MVAIETPDRISAMLDLTAPISAEKKDRPGQAVQIVLDRSGSMSGAPFTAAKESLLKLIDRLAPQDSFGLVTFDDQALVNIPIKKMSEHSLAGLRTVIRQLRTGGSTDLSAGYLLGLRELNTHPQESGSTLLLISDGHANAGEKDPAILGAVATKSATQKITTSTIGMGNGYDEKLLEAITQGGGGSHRFAYTIDEAVGAIAAEVNDLLDKCAVNMVLRITPVQGMAGAPTVEILQRLPYWKDGETYVVQLGDLYAGENRRFMIGFDVPQIAALGLATIAEITLQYLDLAQMTEMTVTLPVQVNVVPDDIAKGRIADPVVLAERLVLEAQKQKQEASLELETGKVKDAISRFKSTAENLRRQASQIPVDDPRTSESLTIIRTEADEMERLAGYAEHEDANYANKRNYESMSRNSRARKLRPTQEDIQGIDPDYLEP